jgi:hypothetical protein
MVGKPTAPASASERAVGESLRVWVAMDSMGTLYRDSIVACARGETSVTATVPFVKSAEPEPEPEPEPELYEAEEAVPRAGREGSDWRHPVLVLLPLKLGLGRYINPRYVPALAALFRLV